MTAVFFYNGIDLGNTTVRLGSIDGLTEMADQGQMGVSSVPFDDPLGTRAPLLLPHRAFLMYEHASSDIHAYNGYSTLRSYQRADSLLTGAAGRITVTFVDLNASFAFKVIHHGTFHYKRPAETDIERITWLRSVSAGLLDLADNGLIDTANPVDMTAVDYTGQFPLQVMQDCAERSGKNFYCYADPTTGEKSLAYFRSTDASFNPSTLSISNVLSDRSATCFAPIGASLTRDPSEVFDGVLLQYSGGEVYVRATGRILPRDTIAPSSNTSSRLGATRLAERVLAASELEAERVTCTVQLPASQVNLLKAGMMVNARFTYMDDWDPGIDVRVLQRSIKQDEENDQFYNVEVILGHPVITNFTTGPGGDNSRVWPSDLPPFVPGTGGGTPTYVQSQKLQSAAGTSPETITLGAAPTSGNLLGIYIGQVQSSGNNSYTLPTGWTVNDVYDPPGSAAPADFCQMVLYSKISDGTETSVLVSWAGTGPLEIFYFEYSGASGFGGFAHGQQAASATFVLPSVTPTTGLPTAILAFLNWDPDYTVVSPLANLRQFQTRSGWAARAAQSYSDTIVASASGSYDGTTSGTVGAETGYAAIVAWLTGGTLLEPSIGQPVAPESRTSDGSRVIYTTNYPYQPGSLVVKVNGNILAGVTETSPSTGVFTLPAPPAVGSVITWTYNVADPAPTGANNPQATSNPPAVPPGPGSMPGGDGTSRPPDQEYTPAETPNDVLTVFTIVPYIAGQAFVYINGLIQRKGTDWNELSPSSGTIEFTTAPWTGASITVKAMPVTAPPTGSGFSNPALYGSGLNADTKANIQMGPEGQVGLRFKAGASSALNSIRIQARGGPVYSGGTGGSYTVTVKAVDASGNPTGSALATQTYTPGNPGGAWTSYDLITWSSPATLVSGTKYVVGFLNADGSPLVNYVSINCLYIFGGTLTPRQPKYTDDDFAVLVNVSSWLTRTQYTSNIDLTYASGYHDGQGYVQLFTAQYGTITGTTTMVRENFTVSGGARTVISCAVRVRRSSGTDPLILGLYTSGGALIEAVSIPAGLVPISAAGSDNGGSVWVGGRFLTPHILANATNYYLRLSCASSSTYTAAPIRKGNDNGFSSTLVFSDGTGQFTTNSGGTWTDLYTFDSVGPDLQFYLGTTS